MKSIKKVVLLLAIALTAAILCTGQGRSAKAAEENVLTTDGVPKTADFTIKSKPVAFKFTVDKPSKIKVDMNAAGIGTMGSFDYAFVALCEDSAGTSPITSKGFMKLNQVGSVSDTASVEPGSYYAVFVRNPGWSSATDGIVSASVTVTDVLEGARGTKPESAISIKPNEKYAGIATCNGTGELYYKINLTKRSKLQIFSSIRDKDELGTKEPYTVRVLNGHEVEKGAKNISVAAKVAESSLSLDKGTYYIVFDYKKSPFTGPVTLSTAVTALPVQAKVNAIKAGTKRITGTAEKNAEVYAVIGKKRYTEDVSSTGKFSISVPALKKGTTVSVYVKNNIGQSASKVIKVK